MASQAAVTVFDGVSTPVSHLFTEAGVEKSAPDEWSAYWKELNASLPEAALNRLTFRQRKQKDGRIRVGVRFDIPVMESVSGVNSSGYTAPPKVAYVDSAEYVAYVHPRSTEAGRRLVRMLVVNLMNGITTSQVPFSGQAPVLVDKLGFPS